MYPILHQLLSDKKGGKVFELFGPWHFFYIALTLAVIAVVLRKTKGEDGERTAKGFSDLAFGLYILDFFLMPLAYGEIDVEKLPFHACTAMCVLCFLSWRVDFLERYRSSLAMLCVQPGLSDLSGGRHVARGPSTELSGDPDAGISWRYDGLLLPGGAL